MAVAKAKAKAKAPPVTGQFYAVMGSDDAEVKRVAGELAGQLTPTGGDDFGRDVIDGAVQYADDAVARIHATIEALLTFPFFGGEKLVWLKSASFLADNPQGRSEAVLEALDKLLQALNSGIPPGTRFLLSAVAADKRRSFYKNFSKIAKVEVRDQVDSSKTGWEEDAAHLVSTQARQRGLRFTSDSQELFVLNTGGDRQVIGNELEKLDLYLGAGRREVSAEDVRLLVPLSRAGIVFELGNALAQRHLARALGLLKQLLFQGETPIGIMYASIIPTVRNLLLVKDLMTQHRLSRPAQPFAFGSTVERLPADAIYHLPRKKDGGISGFQLGIAAGNAQRFSVDELRAGFASCLEANICLVTSPLDPEVVLGQLLVKIISKES